MCSSDRKIRGYVEIFGFAVEYLCAWSLGVLWEMCNVVTKLSLLKMKSG